MCSSFPTSAKTLNRPGSVVSIVSMTCHGELKTFLALFLRNPPKPFLLICIR